MAQLSKTLYEASETELRNALSYEAKRVDYSYADIEGELERRKMERQTTRSFVLSIVAVIVAGLSLLASVLVALFINREP